MASIKKRQTSRGTRYDVRVWVGDRQVSKTFQRRADADQWARVMESDRAFGIAHDPHAGRTLFADYADRWMDSRDLAPRTVELYRDLLRRMILPTFGKVPVGKISPESVRRWNKATKADRSPMQAAKAYRLLRAVLNTAIADGLITRNPCQIPKAGQERSPERPILTPDLVLDLADAIAPRYKALVLLAGFGGLRRGELLGLHRRNVDLERGRVTVEGQVVIMANEGRVETRPKSDAGRRTVTIPAPVVAALREHLDQYAQPGPDGYVFTGDKGGPLVSASLYPAFNAARDQLGLEGVTLHDLRHTAGTLAAWTGATTRELMQRLGHSSTAAAMRYQHAAEDRDQAISDALGALIDSTDRTPKAPVVRLTSNG